VLLSHMHEDHFDRAAEEKLDKPVPIVTTRRAAASLRKLGFKRALGLKNWRAVTFRKGDARLCITSMPGRHGPGPLAAALPAVMGSMLEFGPVDGQPVFRLYITGDTLVHEDLEDIPRLFPNIDLALVHLGGTKVPGVMLTMDGKQGVRAMQIVAPDMAIPIHYNDYTAFKSPLDDFKKEVRAAGLEDQVRYLRHGETHTFQVSRGWADARTGAQYAGAGVRYREAVRQTTMGSEYNQPAQSAE